MMRVIPLAISLFFTLLPLLLVGAVVPVTSAADAGSGSLRTGIATAAPGDTLLVQVSDTIFLATPLKIDKPLVIQANGAILHGRDTTRLMEVDYNLPVVIADLTFCHGNAQWNKPNDYTVGGGAIYNRGQLTLSNCIFHHNTAGFGGAIEHNGQGGFQPDIYAKLTLSNCSFFANISAQTTVNTYSYEAHGGAIFCISTLGGKFHLQAENTTFSGNTAQAMGGAVYAVRGDNLVGFDSVQLIHCTLTHNTAAKGGAIEARPGTATVMLNSILAGNTATDILPDFRGTLFANGGNLLGQPTSMLNYDLREEGSANVKNQPPKLSGLMQLAPQVWGHIPLCNSPLLGAANVPTGIVTDARGEFHGGTSDIGAIERSPADLTITTTASNGYHSLRAAVALACPADVLSLQALNGDIQLTEAITVDKSLTISGSPGPYSTLSTTDTVRLLHVEPGVALTLQDIRFTGGNPTLYGGGAILNKGRLTADRCLFTGHSAPSGGAIACYGAGDTAKLTLTNCYFGQNTARDLAGGAIDLRQITHPAILSARFCTFASNNAGFTGGALFADENCSITLHNSLMYSNNSADVAVSARHITSLGHNACDDTTGMSAALLASDRLLHSSDMLAWQHSLGTFWVPAAGSVASNSAEAVASIATDLLGSPRSMGGGPDMGAIEYDLTGLQAPVTQAGLRVWPQPARNRVVVESDRALQSVSLFGADGRHLTTLNVNALQATFSVEGLPAGVYALRATDTNGAVSCVTLLIQP